MAVYLIYKIFATILGRGCVLENHGIRFSATHYFQGSNLLAPWERCSVLSTKARLDSTDNFHGFEDMLCFDTICKAVRYGFALNTHDTCMKTAIQELTSSSVTPGHQFQFSQVRQ